MKILEKYNAIAISKSRNIGIGLGELKDHNLKILNASLQFIHKNKSRIYLFGKELLIEELSKNKNYKRNKSQIILVKTLEPEKEIIEFLNINTINAVIRGSLNSNKFLKYTKKRLEISEIHRLALLETFKGQQFFFGPVGIDECNNIKSKKLFIEKALKELELLNLKPNISILSGGRVGDIGRNPYVDKTINEAQELVTYFELERPGLEITHTEILIEKAINNKSNLIIAPNGLSGNLIYRTLVHLGGGRAYGAIYMDIGHIIIDTSRVGGFSEIYGGLILTLALIP